jgi:hypothetical protein
MAMSKARQDLEEAALDISTDLIILVKDLQKKLDAVLKELENIKENMNNYDNYELVYNLVNIPDIILRSVGFTEWQVETILNDNQNYLESLLLASKYETSVTNSNQ